MAAKAEGFTCLSQRKCGNALLLVATSEFSVLCMYSKVGIVLRIFQWEETSLQLNFCAWFIVSASVPYENEVFLFEIYYFTCLQMKMPTCYHRE